MVKLSNQYYSRYMKKRDAQLFQKYIVPVTILKRIGKVAYKIDVPTWQKVHLIFHVSFLKPYHDDMKDPTYEQTTHKGLKIQAHGIWVDETILDNRVTAQTQWSSRIPCEIAKMWRQR